VHCSTVQVTTYSDQNKMTAGNLAIVITPNVVRTQWAMGSSVAQGN
jgi:hypothetical protein